MLRLLKTLALILMTIVLILFLYPWVLRGLGYYVDNTGGEIGRLAAEKGDVSLCQKIVVYSHFFGPPTMSRRGECVYTYAELTKDPSACELLMPSSYGLSCVGGAIETKKTCNFTDDSISWWEDEKNDIVGKASLHSCQADDASRSKKRNECCLIARVARVKSENDCSSLSTATGLHDECLAALAFKNRDINTCTEIQDQNLQTACSVRAKAMQQDPSICSGCKQPVEKLEDLK